MRRGLDVAENLEPRLEQIREAMALAFDLGPRLVTIPIGKLDFPPLPQVEGAEATSPPPSILIPSKPPSGADLLKESLDALGKHGDRTGVNVALEAGLDDPAAVVANLERFDAGSLGVDFNPANLLLNGFNPYDAIQTFAKRLIHVHAQDARRISPSKLATVALGHGDLDWLQLLAHFEEIDYRGHVTVLADDRNDVAAGVAFLQRFVR